MHMECSLFVLAILVQAWLALGFGCDDCGQMLVDMDRRAVPSAKLAARM